MVLLLLRLHDVVMPGAFDVVADAARPWPGATVDGRQTRFRVWAPEARVVEVLVDGRTPVPMKLGADGYHDVSVDVGAGARYWFRLDGGDPLPDLASRFQPEGPHGSSMVVDPSAFTWTDAAWRGLSPRGLVVYEMHVGTFTAQGTWRAAGAHLAALADLGITTIEVMPVAEFPGRFGWGYDGVSFFAPAHEYGSPNDLRRFVDRAHAVGIGVVLDVVYNHAGPDGNWFSHYTPSYLGAMSEWGQGFNFDGPASPFVRAFFEANAAYWITEFHIDGLRLDATQQIFDTSTPHILQTLGTAARRAASPRSIWIVGENEPQQTALIRGVDEGGHGLDALWNDDFHHAAFVAATGRREAYYSDYAGTAQELVSCATRGFLYQGQRSSWQRKRRGTDTRGLPPHAFVAFLQNHDQIANSIDGRRLHALTSPALHRALTTLLLLGPWTPMLFQGDEFAASSPFLYFADHRGELATAVARGRREFLSQFPSIRDATRDVPLRAPHASETFEVCRVDHDEARRHEPTWRLHRDLLELRRTHEAFVTDGPVAGAVLGPRAFVLRSRAGRGGPLQGDRLLVLNLDRSAVTLDAPAEPLLAPQALPWTVLFSSNAPRYGGAGHVLACDGEWVIPPESATVLA